MLQETQVVSRPRPKAPYYKLLQKRPQNYPNIIGFTKKKEKKKESSCAKSKYKNLISIFHLEK